MMGIFSCVYCPSIYDFFENVYLDLMPPPLFWIGLFLVFFVTALYELFVYGVNEAPVGGIACKYFLPVCGLYFVLFDFLCCAKAFKFDWVPFVYFCFYLYCLGRLT